MERLAAIDIDLDALAHNVRVARQLIGEAKLYGVVKGDAYGVGVAAAAPVMAEAGVDGFAAGDVEDAAALAKMAPHLPVLLYGVYEPTAIPALAKAGVIPTLFSPECVETAVAAREPMKVAIEVDCGFGRLGLLEGELPDALAQLAKNSAITVHSLYTHLGAVEDAAEVLRQTEQFGRMAALARASGFPALEAMAASSRVAIGYPSLNLDAVNPGRLLYGLLEGSWKAAVETRPVFASARSRLIQIKRLAPGARLGYGVLDADGRGSIRAGVAAVGFAGGLPREFGSATVLVRGRRAPVLGLASMEHLLIDLDAVPEAEIGDEALLFGRQGAETISSGDFAAALGFTELELLPRLGRLLPRRYLRSGPNF